jgi:hypothetical protein
MSLNTQPLNVDALLSEVSRKTRRLSIWIFVLFLLLLVSTGTVSFLFWRKGKALDEAQKEVAFSLWVTDYNSGADFVVPQVNMIQFLRRGYSISFDTVKYTQEGLVLNGTIGNGTELYLNSLAVNFSARPYPYQIKEKWEKQKYPWWADEWNIPPCQHS